MTGQPYLCHRCTRMHNDSDLMPPCVAEMLVWNRPKVVCPACKGDGSIPWLVTRKGEPTTRPCATCTPNRGWVAEGAVLVAETELADKPEDEGFSTRGDVKWLVADRASIPDNGSYRVLIVSEDAPDIKAVAHLYQSHDATLMTSPRMAQRELSDNNVLAATDDYSLTDRIGATK